MKNSVVIGFTLLAAAGVLAVAGCEPSGGGFLSGISVPASSSSGFFVPAPPSIDKGAQMNLQTGHAGGLIGVSEISPDGTRLLTGGSDKTARLWDIATGSQLRVFTGHYGSIRSLSFSPDGKLALISENTRSILWALETGNKIGHFSASRGTFLPDGRRLLLGGIGSGVGTETVIMFDVIARKVLWKRRGHISRKPGDWQRRELITTIAVTQDGRYGVTGISFPPPVIAGFIAINWQFYELQVKLWKNQTSRGWTSPILMLWDLEQGKYLDPLPDAGDGVDAAAFSPDGRRLLTSSPGRHILLIDVDSRKVIHRWQHDEYVTTLTLFADGKTALIGARLYDASTGKLLHTFLCPSMVLEDKEPTAEELRAYEGCADSDRSTAEARFGSGLPNGHSLSGNGFLLTGDVIWEVPGEDIAKAGFIGNLGDNLDRQFSAAAQGKGSERASSKVLVPVAASILDEEQLAVTPAVTWDLKTGRVKSESSTFSTCPWCGSAISADGRRVLTGFTDWSHYRRDTDETISIAGVSDGDSSGNKSVTFLSNDGLFILNYGYPDHLGQWRIKVEIWDAATKAIRHSFDLGTLQSMKASALSPDGRLLAIAGCSNDDSNNYLSGKAKNLRVYRLPEGKRIWDTAGHTHLDWKKKVKSECVEAVAFSPDGRYLVTGSDEGSYQGSRFHNVKVWRADTGDEVMGWLWEAGQTLKGISPNITRVAFSPDGRLVAAGNRPGEIAVWDMASGALRHHLSGHNASITAIRFSRDGRFILSASKDGTLRLWSAGSGAELLRLTVFENGEWVAQTPEGYYVSSANGHNYLKVNVGTEIFSIDQFYDVFYRPDIVQAKLRGEDIAKLAPLSMADAVKNLPPEVEIDAMPRITSDERVKIRYRVKSLGGGIGEIRVFHNGKLVYSDGTFRVYKVAGGIGSLGDMNGETINRRLRSLTTQGGARPAGPIQSRTKGRSFVGEVEIEPIPGENHVSITAFNGQNSIRSRMRTSNFVSLRPRGEPSLYVLAVGIDKYRDPSANLAFAVKDAEDFSKRLAKQVNDVFPASRIHVQVLRDEKATRAGIKAAIDSLAGKVKPWDRVVLYFAAHGVLFDTQYFLVTHDFDGELNPGTNMISSNEIIEATKNIKALSQLLVLDTCHAGGVDDVVSGLYDARMSVLARKMGLHIYAAASTLQAALDGYKGNGLFTHTLLAGLDEEPKADGNQDKTVSVAELGVYAQERTKSISRGLGFEQIPIVIRIGEDPPLYHLGRGPVAEDKGSIRLVSPTPGGRTFEMEEMNKRIQAYDEVVVRAEPFLDSKELSRLPARSVVTATGEVREAGWFRVAHNGQTGYLAFPSLSVFKGNADGLGAWMKIENSTKISDFESFLETHPDDVLAGKASRRMAGLRLRSGSFSSKESLRDKALELYGRAFEAAQGIEADSRWALKYLSKAQLDAGDRAAARRSVESLEASIEVGYLRASRLNDVAGAWAYLGDLDRAFATVGKLRNNRNKDEARSEIAQSLAERKDFPAAIEITRKIRNKDIAEKTLGSIAGTQARKLDIRSALQTLRRVADPKILASAFQSMALTAHQAGGAATARKLYRKSFSAAEAIPSHYDKGYQLLNLAKYQIDYGGFLDDARRSLSLGSQSLSNVRRYWNRKSLTTSIAVIQAKLGDLDGALETLGKLLPGDGIDELVETLPWKSDWRAALRRAAELIAPLSGNNRDYALGRVVYALLDKAERPEEARGKARLITAQGYRGTVMARIASSYAGKGRYEIAMRFADKITDTEGRDAAYGNICYRMARNGYLDRALELAERIGTPEKRTDAFSNIASAILEILKL